MRVRHLGQWKDSETYVKHNGVWKPAASSVRHKGEWQEIVSLGGVDEYLINIGEGYIPNRYYKYYGFYSKDNIGSIHPKNIKGALKGKIINIYVQIIVDRDFLNGTTFEVDGIDDDGRKVILTINGITKEFTIEKAFTTCRFSFGFEDTFNFMSSVGKTLNMRVET